MFVPCLRWFLVKLGQELLVSEFLGIRRSMARRECGRQCALHPGRARTGNPMIRTHRIDGEVKPELSVCDGFLYSARTAGGARQNIAVSLKQSKKRIFFERAQV